MRQKNSISSYQATNSLHNTFSCHGLARALDYNAAFSHHLKQLGFIVSSSGSETAVKLRNRKTFVFEFFVGEHHLVRLSIPSF